MKFLEFNFTNGIEKATFAIGSTTKRLQFESNKLNVVVNKMKVFFATKNENNTRREEEFVKLSPIERLISFIEMISSIQVIPSQDDEHPNHRKNNFVIQKKDGKEFC